MSEWPPLAEGEVLLPDPDPSEIIFRALRPQDVDEGEIASTAFELSSLDKKTMRLSGARASVQTANGVYAEQNALRAGGCAEVCGLTVSEIEDAGPLRVIDDHVYHGDVTGHASLDCTVLSKQSKNARRDVREALAVYATDRGRLDALGAE